MYKIITYMYKPGWWGVMDYYCSTISKDIYNNTDYVKRSIERLKPDYHLRVIKVD